MSARRGIAGQYALLSLRRAAAPPQTPPDPQPCISGNRGTVLDGGHGLVSRASPLPQVQLAVGWLARLGAGLWSGTGRNMPLPLGPVPDIMPPMEDPNFRKSRKRKKSRGADNSALKQTETGEVDAVGLDTATLAGRASRKKRKRQSRSELVTGAGEPEPLGGRGDADSLTLSNSETMVTLSEHKRKHKHKHKRKHGHDFSLSLESEAGSTHQLARHRHRHRRHHQESSSATETHIRPEPDAQTARKHRHKHRHKHKHKHRHEKPSQSSTVDNSQEDPDGRGGHQHRHKQREATHHAEPAPDRRMGSTLQVEGVEELSERQLARFHESEDQYHSLHSQWFRSTQENRERLREKSM